MKASEATVETSMDGSSCSELFLAVAEAVVVHFAQPSPFPATHRPLKQGGPLKKKGAGDEKPSDPIGRRPREYPSKPRRTYMWLRNMKPRDLVTVNSQ